MANGVKRSDIRPGVILQGKHGWLRWVINCDHQGAWYVMLYGTKVDDDLAASIKLLTSVTPAALFESESDEDDESRYDKPAFSAGVSHNLQQWASAVICEIDPPAGLRINLSASAAEYRQRRALDDAQELADLRASVAHIHAWIHSGDRETDPSLQAEQWGDNVCEWLTGYCDRLRARVRQLEGGEA